MRSLTKAGYDITQPRLVPHFSFLLNQVITFSGMSSLFASAIKALRRPKKPWAGLNAAHQQCAQQHISASPNQTYTGGWKFTPELRQRLNHYARFRASGVTLKEMVQFGQYPCDGTLFRASQFIVEELPIRLAHRVRDLETLPHQLSEMPSIKRVINWYAQSFEELTEIQLPPLKNDIKDMLYRPSHRKISVPIPSAKSGLGISSELGTADSHKGRGPAAGRYYNAVEPGVQWPLEVQQYNELVTKTLQNIKARHDGVVATVAQGVVEWKQSEFHVSDSDEVQTFLDRFYMSRIGIRMLIGQHIALNMDRGIRDDFVGIICTDTNVKEITQTAIDNARFICEDWYGLFEAPQVILHSNDENINFLYVAGHLSHMIFEVVKNSLRAVVESYGVECENFPPVKVIIAQGEEDITIKISDEGGGIPRRSVDKVWTYMYTTAKETPSLELDTSRSEFKAPMAGFGYGLPVSRLYARYFGGDLKLISMEGYGTDVYLHLNRLSTGQEPLE